MNTSKLKALLIEDNTICQLVVRTLLEHYGYIVDIANDGKTAINIINSKKFDIFFIDIGLPDMDGYEVARNIREINKNSIIYALTAQDIDEHRKMFFDACIEKPLTQEKLENLFCPEKSC
jgi:CheY-like chemotaxis protein